MRKGSLESQPGWGMHLFVEAKREVESNGLQGGLVELGQWMLKLGMEDEERIGKKNVGKMKEALHGCNLKKEERAVGERRV